MASSYRYRRSPAACVSACAAALALVLLAAPSKAETGQPATPPSVEQELKNQTVPAHLPPLSGLAEFNAISASASDLSGRISPGCRLKGYRCIELRVKNNRSEPVVVDGERTAGQVNGKLLQPESAEKLTGEINCGMSYLQASLVGAIGLGTLGLAGPMAYEVFEKPKYPGAPYGRDNVTHLVQGDRFGQRLILPGDETEGWLCFRCGPESTPRSLTIPIYSRSQAGQVTVTVSPANAKGAGTENRER